MQQHIGTLRITPQHTKKGTSITITSHLRCCRLHHPAPPRHQHLLSAGLQQRHRRGIVRLDVEVRRPQRAPLATPFDPVAVVKCFVARVLEPPPAPPTTGPSPPASSAPISATTVTAVAPAATATVSASAAATPVAAATASGRAAATTPTPVVEENGREEVGSMQTDYHI